MKDNVPDLFWFSFGLYCVERFLYVFLIKGSYVCILQSQEAFLAGTDLDNVFDVVNEDFTITDLAGMKNCFCSVNNFLNRYKAYNDLDLNLRAEVHVYFNTR